MARVEKRCKKYGYMQLSAGPTNFKPRFDDIKVQSKKKLCARKLQRAEFSFNDR